MVTIEYGAMSSKYKITADNKLTAYCAMCAQYQSSAHLIAIYTDEFKEDSWINITGQISERLDEIFGGENAFDNYFQENIPAIKEAYNSIEQLV